MTPIVGSCRHVAWPPPKTPVGDAARRKCAANMFNVHMRIGGMLRAHIGKTTSKAPLRHAVCFTTLLHDTDEWAVDKCLGYFGATTHISAVRLAQASVKAFAGVSYPEGPGANDIICQLLPPRFKKLLHVLMEIPEQFDQGKVMCDDLEVWWNYESVEMATVVSNTRRL